MSLIQVFDVHSDCTPTRSTFAHRHDRLRSSYSLVQPLLGPRWLPSIERTAIRQPVGSNSSLRYCSNVFTILVPDRHLLLEPGGHPQLQGKEPIPA